MKRELVLTDQGWTSQSVLWSIFYAPIVWLTLSSWYIIICLNCSALTKRFKELMTEFQVTLQAMLFFSVISFSFDLSLWYNVSDSKTKDPRGVSWGCGETSHYRFGYLAYKLAEKVYEYKVQRDIGLTILALNVWWNIYLLFFLFQYLWLSSYGNQTRWRGEPESWYYTFSLDAYGCHHNWQKFHVCFRQLTTW